MARMDLIWLALFIGGLADALKKGPQKVAGPEFLHHEVDVLNLYYHIHEPIHEPELQVITNNWEPIKNVEHFNNHTAVKLYDNIVKTEMLLPRGVPFSVFEDLHVFEAKILFHVLYSAKDFSSFYKAAVYLRNRVNEGLFVYVLSVVLLHRPDTQGIVIPPIYEIFPSYFHNSLIMNMAQRINTHGKRMIERYPSTYVWDDNVVIRWNSTSWPYYHDDVPISYFTHDVTFNTQYYNIHLMYPSWLSSDIITLNKDSRGEFFWFYHKQILARYYMERLSNDLGEIPELGLDVVQPGYAPEISYYNGIPFPVRPNHFHLDQPEFIGAISNIIDYEHRIREAIDRGYFVNHLGEHVDIQSPEAIEVLGRLIEANVDSPNTKYYKDFISIWKALLGNSIWPRSQYYKDLIPLVVPSVLENYQTALRDPAFYMIWKRVLGLFSAWQRKLPPYSVEQLKIPSVSIKSVELDDIVTYFEHIYFNVSNSLYMNEFESKAVIDEVSVLVQRPQLNHKDFNVRINVKSDVAKSVVVKFFLAPKYDSKGYEIPLHENFENFYLFDQFLYDLPVGEVEIKRKSVENIYTIRNWMSGIDAFEKANSALNGQGQFVLDKSHEIDGVPEHLLLPKGRVGGMPFVLLVYISEHSPSNVSFESNFDPAVSYDTGSGAQPMTSERFGYPLDRPLYQRQLDLIPNMHVQDIKISHKPVPEVTVL